MHERPFSSLADINPPVIIPSEVGPDSPVSFVPMGDISEGGGWNGRQTRMLRQVARAYTPFQEDDILFAKITPCMENAKGAHMTGVVNGVGFGSTEFHVLRAIADASSRFLYHLSQSPHLRLRAEQFMTGSAGQRRVQAAFFDHFLVPAPPLPEQRLIAEILDTIDEAIRKTEAIVAKLGQVKQGLLHDLLTRGIDEHGQLRDPDRHPEQFKDSPLGRIPKVWEVMMLGEIGRPRQWPTISQSKLTSSGYPVFGANGHIGFYTEFNHEEPTVAITCRGATCGNVHLTPPKCYITGNAMALDEVERELVDPLFLAAAVRTRGMADCITGSAQPQIIGSAVRQVSLAVPAISEQRSIVRVLNRIEYRVTAEVATVEKLRDLKSGLMADLLTGRVRVTNLLQEVAT